MTNRRQRRAGEIAGLEIYQDSKGTIFYDFITKKGYFLVSSDVRTYLIYEAALPLAIIFGCALFLGFKLSALVSIIAAIVIYVVLFFVFRIFYLYRLPVAENWVKPKRESPVKYLATKYSKGKVIALIVLFFLTSALMAADVFIDNLEGYTRIGMFVFAGAALIGCIISLLALSYKKKNNINY